MFFARQCDQILVLRFSAALRLCAMQGFALRCMLGLEPELHPQPVRYPVGPDPSIVPSPHLDAGLPLHARPYPVRPVEQAGAHSERILLFDHLGNGMDAFYDKTDLLIGTADSG